MQGGFSDLLVILKYFTVGCLQIICKVRIKIAYCRHNAGGLVQGMMRSMANWWRRARADRSAAACSACAQRMHCWSFPGCVHMAFT